MIRAETDPVDYICALYGHPSTWTVDGATVLEARVEERNVALRVSVEPREAGVLVVRNAQGHPIWEAEIQKVVRRKECEVCLKEK